MSVNMRQGISATVSQQLVMTAQQQQSLKLLQCSAVDLEAELTQVLHDNPLLELQDAGNSESAESIHGDEQDQSYGDENYQTTMDKSPSSGTSDNDDYYIPEMANTVSLQDYLFEQLGTSPANEEEKTLVSYLIGDIDENGYLSTPLEELASLLSEDLKETISLEKLTHALTILQGFDPAGIAARSLSECLVLQLLPERLSFCPDSLVLNTARQICQEGLEALATAKLEHLETLTHTDIGHIRQAHQLIKQLSPRPGKAWSTPAADYAVPDVLTHWVGDKWVLVLNPQVLPKVRIHPEYERMVKVMDKKTLSQSPELSERLKQARLFLIQLKQRFATILLVAQAIMTHQNDFFALGFAGLRPLTLKDIANELGLHESTISRATVQKFIATPHGVFELKRFFSAALNTVDGDQTSSTSIQLKLRQLLEKENPQKPLSDSKLCDLLTQEGVVIARRTVAKYREAMGFAAASQRKSQALLKG